MADDADRAEEIMAKRQKANDYLQKLISGKVIVIGEENPKTKIRYYPK